MNVSYLVWIRTDDTEDELYRVATADTLDEVLDIISRAGVTKSRYCVTPAELQVSLVVEA